MDGLITRRSLFGGVIAIGAAAPGQARDLPTERLDDDWPACPNMMPEACRFQSEGPDLDAEVKAIKASCNTNPQIYRSGLVVPARCQSAVPMELWVCAVCGYRFSKPQKAA